MKAKLNLVEDKPKHRFMNSKDKKFKKPNHFHYSPYGKSSSLIFGQKTDGRFCYVCERTNHLSPWCFNRKKKQVKAQPRENGENGGHKVNMMELNSNSLD